MPVTWNPWHGCRRVSEGCRHCYVYRQDAARQRDGGQIVRTAAYDLPVRRSRDGRWKIPARETVFTCFTSDFLLPEADAWRAQAWEMIRLRRDLRFMFFTKRIERLAECLPDDWGAGWEHVTVGCTVENQRMADCRLPLFLELPLRHRVIVCAPLLGPIDLGAYLSPAIEECTVGGESGPEARVCDYDWVLALRDQCVAHGVPFRFHQTGARLLRQGHLYRIPRSLQHDQARRAGIDFGIEYR